jgi:PAS domain S-box-containing protein
MRTSLHPLARYSLAVIGTALVALLSVLFPTAFQATPFFLPMMVVLVCAWYGGAGPGVLATALGGLTAGFLLAPVLSFRIEAPGNTLRLTLFLVVAATFSILLGLLQTSRAAARALAEALRSQGEELRVTLASIGDGVIVTDPEGRITFLNAVAATLTGWPPCEAMNKPLQEVFVLLNEDTGLPMDNPVARALAQGAVVGLANNSLLRARDGSGRPIDDTAAPIRDKAGRTTGVVLVFRDVTAQRHAEREREGLLTRLEAERAVLDTLLECTPVGVGFLDRECRFVRANAALAHIDGIPPEHYPERRPWELLPELRGLLEPIYRQVVETGLPSIGKELSGQTPAAPGQQRHWLASHYPVRTPDGKLLGVGVVVVDITARKFAEQALLEADRHKDEFLALLAHELRNPLAPMRNAVVILRLEGGGHPVVEQMGAMLERQVQHMVRLVDDLLDVSRISRGKLELRKERIDLAEVVARTAENTRPLMEERRHYLEVDVCREALPVDGDAARLEQILTNLLHNAARYTEQGGRVRLTAGREGSEAVVRVQDNGIGIRPEMLGRIFELFTQADRVAGRVQEGLGLGLTLVRRLVGMHGGSVTALSDGPGTGSEFVVRLPLAAATAPEGRAPASVPGGRRPLRVLVVDDNVDAAESLAQLLRLEGHEVQVAYDGPMALERAPGFGPHVVLLDIGLPGGMDGYEVARQLQALHGMNGMRLIAMSGYGQDEDRRRSVEAGFRAHCVKPLELSELRALLSQEGA